MSTDAITTPPSAVAFKDALKKGLGRAMLLLKAEPGSHLLQAELARACKINLVYDSQCEEPRAAYLYRLIRETGQVQFYMATLSRCLGDGTEEGEESDLTQAFCVLRSVFGGGGRARLRSQRSVRLSGARRLRLDVRLRRP